MREGREGKEWHGALEGKRGEREKQSRERKRRDVGREGKRGAGWG